MSLINITNLTFGYDGSFENVFENVSFQIDTDWKLGFTGRNGRGKTTFLNLLMGKYEFRGKITKNVNFDYFPFQIENKNEMTIKIINKICPDLEEWRLSKELSNLELSEELLERPFNTLSGGEQTKILLASLFLKENNFLLIDEPTNHIDQNARQIISNYLKTKKGFILVSHDRIFLDNCIDHILSINKTNIEIQKGNFSTWWKNKQMQDNYEFLENEKITKEIIKLKESAKRKASWSNDLESTKFGAGPVDRGYIGHKASKLMKTSKVIETRQNKAIEDKSLLLKNVETSDSLSIRQIPFTRQRIIEINNVSIKYDEKTILSGISFAINSGDRVVLKGKNGSGKTSLIKLITGGKVDYSGEFKMASNLIISYVSQDTSFLKGTLKEFAKDNKINESLFKTILRKLDFSRNQLEKDMKDFSGGQKKKVLIAKSLSQQAHLYVWDEPLNFIDVISRMQIEELIKQYNPTMLFVEHDNFFVKSVATREIML